MPAPALVIRDPRPGDEAAWRLLWSGYIAFYESEVSEAVTAATWQRLFMPGSGMFGRLAEWDGAVAGFTISVVHPGSWTLSPVCYLEDLFVDPKMRGHGLGRALIEDLSHLPATAAGRGSIGTHAKGTRRRGFSTTASPRPTISSATGSSWTEAVPCASPNKNEAPARMPAPRLAIGLLMPVA